VGAGFAEPTIVNEDIEEINRPVLMNALKRIRWVAQSLHPRYINFGKNKAASTEVTIATRIINSIPLSVPFSSWCIGI